MELRDYQTRSIQKLRDSINAGFKRPILRLDCGAGKTVTAGTICVNASKKGKEVLFLVHRMELLEQTEKTLIKLGCDMNKVKVGMVLTVGNNLHKYNPDLIIADECNFALSKTWKKVFDEYQEAIIIGLSATPVRLSGEAMGDVFDCIVEDITAKELIERGNLCGYEYYAPPIGINFENIGIRGGDYKKEDIEQEFEKIDIFGDVLKTFESLAKHKKTIAYCYSVEHSKEICRDFLKNGYSAEHIDGDVPKKKRKEIIERFRSGKTQILCNCNLVSFGFDVPDCDCVILLRPTKSLALYIQSSMRCMRGRENKKAIILDFVGNVFRHGFPDDEREWTLEGNKKKKKEENTVFVKQCPECFFTYSQTRICPNCGHKVEPTEAEIVHNKEIELIQLDEERKNRIKEQAGARKTIHECKTFPECVEWCKQNGKKPGYAYFHWKNRGYNVKFG